MIKSIIKIFCKYLVLSNLNIINYFIIKFFFKKTKSKINKDTIILLALNPFRFRNDLETIEKEKNILIYRFSFPLQCFLFSCFYSNIYTDIGKNKDPFIMKEQQKYQKYLNRFLAKLFSIKKIQAVIGAGVYRQDYDIEIVSKNLGVPVLICTREGNLNSVETKNSFKKKCIEYAPFHGTVMLVHNDIQRDIAIKTGYVKEENIYKAGIIRMDSWIKTIKNHIKNSSLDKKSVILFSFGPGTGHSLSSPPHWPKNQRKYMPNFCKEVHRTVIKYAKENPDINVIIKCKWKGDWKKNLLMLLSINEEYVKSIRNLTFSYDDDAHNLILKSNVVIGFASTTLAEALIAGKPVILPYFSEISEKKFENIVCYKEFFDCFKISKNISELYSSIDFYCKNSFDKSKNLHRKKELFNKYLSFTDVSSLDRHYEIIKSHVKC